MQGGRQGRGSLFGFDPFGDFGGFGGMRGPQNLVPNFVGGRDPFDDPFFTRPFGNSFDSMFESSFFGPSASPFASMPPVGVIEQQGPQQNKRRGPVIEEINSDDEKAEDEGGSKTRDNPRKHSRSVSGPTIEIPDDDEADGARNKHIQHRNDFSRRRQPQAQSQCYTFQSSTVTYGGGAYYTKSMTKRAGSDGVTFEEFKEADSTTGQANHRISRGIHKKGHTLARKLNSDGRVDTMQTLHNLNEDELAGFEQVWKGSAGKHLHGSRHRLEGGNVEPNSTGQTSRGGWALPSTERQEHPSNNPQIARGFDTTHMQHSMGGAADYAHMQQSRVRPEDRAHMQQAGRRAADRGSRGRLRA